MFCNTSGDAGCTDPYHYDAKSYFAHWMTGLTAGSVNLFVMGNTIRVCTFSQPGTGTVTCDRDNSNASDIAVNNGEWVINLWAWKQNYHPSVTATFELVGVANQGTYNNYSDLIYRIALWEAKYIPDVPYTAMSMYIDEPPNTLWQDYATATNGVIAAYSAANTHIPLWIDEYGTHFSNNQGNTQQDQEQGLLGFLGGDICQSLNKAPKFLWIAGNDSPNGADNYFGLVSSFDGNTPVMRPGWHAIDQWYNLQACP
jgi:hypothetical protein